MEYKTQLMSRVCFTLTLHPSQLNGQEKGGHYYEIIPYDKGYQRSIISAVAQQHVLFYEKWMRVVMHLDATSKPMCISEYNDIIVYSNGSKTFA